MLITYIVGPVKFKFWIRLCFVFTLKGEKGGCGEERGDCKQGKGKVGAEEKMFENEDYIYTQSLP